MGRMDVLLWWNHCHALFWFVIDSGTSQGLHRLAWFQQAQNWQFDYAPLDRPGYTGNNKSPRGPFCVTGHSSFWWFSEKPRAVACLPPAVVKKNNQQHKWLSHIVTLRFNKMHRLNYVILHRMCIFVSELTEASHIVGVPAELICPFLI